MKEISILEKTGLTESESKVYLTLIEIGTSTAGPIIKKTGLHRGTTYQVLQRLKEKGLVSSIIKGKKQHFSPVEPKHLLELLKEQEKDLQEILPALQAKLDASKEQQEITVYSRPKGLRSVLDNMLEELKDGGEYFDFGVSGLFKEVMPSYWHLWQRKKKQYRIRSQVIFNEEIKEQKDFLKDYFGEARFHPKEFSSVTDTMIYKDTVVLFIWTAKPPVAIVIRNKDNAESYKNQFKMMWTLSKK